MKVFLLAAFMLLPTLARGSLVVGDIALLGMNSDNPDQFSFLTLTAITAGEQVSFTDKGWDASIPLTPMFYASETGILTWTAPAGGISAGTVISWASGAADFSSVGSFALSTDGDQVLAFQGAAATPTFLSAIQTNSTGWQTTLPVTSSSESYIPSGLTDDAGAVALTTGLDNIWYSGITTGSREELFTAIGNSSNWSGSNSAYSPATSFTIVPEPTNVVVLAMFLVGTAGLSRRRRSV